MDYYFTFGTAHITIGGERMSRYWVRVTLGPEITSNHFMEARMAFIDGFTSLMMEAPDKWSFQYNEEQFLPTKHLYWGGEHTHINHPLKPLNSDDNKQETG
jgi:hypothetical protein